MGVVLGDPSAPEEPYISATVISSGFQALAGINGFTKMLTIFFSRV